MSTQPPFVPPSPPGPSRRSFLRGSALAGGLDTLAGLGFVFVPELTLAAMGADPEMEADTFFLSFVGVFVASVGLGYLWALQRWLKRGDASFLRAVHRAAGDACRARRAGGGDAAL